MGKNSGSRHARHQGMLQETRRMRRTTAQSFRLNAGLEEDDGLEDGEYEGISYIAAEPDETEQATAAPLPPMAE